MNAVVLKRRNDSEASLREIEPETRQPSIAEAHPLPVLLHLPELTVPGALPGPLSGPSLANQPASSMPLSQIKPAPAIAQQSRRNPAASRKRDYLVPILQWRQLVWQSLVGLALVGFFALAYMLVTGGTGIQSDQSASTSKDGQADESSVLEGIDVSSNLPLREETTPPRHPQHPHQESPSATAEDANISTTQRKPPTRIASRPGTEPINGKTLSNVNVNASYGQSGLNPSTDDVNRSQYDYPRTAPQTYRYRPSGSNAGRSEGGPPTQTRESRTSFDPSVRLQGIEPPPFNRDRSRP